MFISDFIRKRYAKSKLAQDLEVTPQCLCSYLRIANQVNDFKFDYPKSPEGEYLTRKGLTDYQVWCVKKLFAMVAAGYEKQQMFVMCDGFKELDQRLNNYLSKKTFLKEQARQPVEMTAIPLESFA